MMIDNRGGELTTTGDAMIGRGFARSRLGVLRSAVAVHSDRFARPRVLSLVALLCCQRVVVVDGGVATTTEIGRLGVWVSATVLTFAAVLVAMVVAPSVAVTVVVTVAGVVALYVCSVRAAIQFSARRMCVTADRPLLVADVAAVRGRRRGDAVMAEVTGFADVRGSRLVLVVKADNEVAIALYRRHGFVETGTRRRKVAMERFARHEGPTAAGSTAVGDAAVSSALPGVGARWLVGSGVVTVGLVAVYWGRPTAWLMPVAATVAVLAAGVDLAVRRVPNVLTGAGAVTSLAVAGVVGPINVSGVLAGAGLMGGPLLVAHLVTRGRTPGLGDAKLAGVLGFTVGAVSPTLAYVTVIAALLAGAGWGVVYRWRTGRRTFPLAPAISLATVAALVYAGFVGAGHRWT